MYWILEIMAWLVLVLGFIGYSALIIAILWVLWKEIRDAWRNQK
jgi:hypothetical protein